MTQKWLIFANQIIENNFNDGILSVKESFKESLAVDVVLPFINVAISLVNFIYLSLFLAEVIELTTIQYNKT